MKSLSRAAVAAFSLVASAAGAATLNGDFESTTADRGLRFGHQLDRLGVSSGKWDVYSEIPGWRTTGGAGIEIQTNGTVGGFAAHSGLRYVELDSHGAGGSNSSMTQDLGPLALGDWTLSFWYASRTGDPATDGIDVSVLGGATATAFATGGDRLAWRLIELAFTVTSGDAVSLTFSATGAQDTLGGFLDDVSVARAPAAIPLPGGAALLIPAIAGLAALKLRRRG